MVSVTTWPYETTWLGTFPRRWDYGITCRSRLVTGPTDEPLGVDYVRDSVLRVVNGAVDDDFISRQITVARQMFEVETGRAALSQTWQLILSGFPSGVIELPRPPLISVESIGYLDSDGETVTLLSGSPAEFTVQPSGQFTPGRVVFLSGSEWPSTSTDADAVTITYTAGYANAEAMPELYKAGMALLVGELYKTRSLSSGVTKSVLDTSRFWRRVF